MSFFTEQADKLYADVQYRLSLIDSHQWSSRVSYRFFPNLETIIKKFSRDDKPITRAVCCDVIARMSGLRNAACLSRLSAEELELAEIVYRNTKKWIWKYDSWISLLTRYPEADSKLKLLLAKDFFTFWDPYDNKEQIRLKRTNNDGIFFCNVTKEKFGTMSASFCSDFNEYIKKEFHYRKNYAYIINGNLNLRTNKVEAYIRFQPHCNKIVIASLTFKTRHNGSGTRFLRFILREALKYNIQYIEIENISSIPFARFAEKFGFEQEKHYLPNAIISTNQLFLNLASV